MVNNNEHSTILSEKSQKARRLLYLLAFSFFSLYSNAQSFYFIAYDVTTKTGIISYKTLLRIEADGNTTARIQYKAGPENKLFLYELSLTDSFTKNDSSKRLLIPNSEPFALLDDDASTAFSPRFILERKQDSSGYYFEPSVVELKMDGASWQPIVPSLIQQKNYDELRQDEPFVNSFYFQTDEFYQYVFGERKKGIPQKRTEKMYLIILANTKDKTVGESAEVDLNNVSGMFNKIAENIGISSVISTYIFGDNFSKSAVQDALLTLEQAKPNEKDIVIFYYSGHGFRMPRDKSKYANISFRTPKNREDNVAGDYMPLEEVYRRLTALKPNVCMVLGDCCNADIYQSSTPGPELFKGKGGGFLGDFNLEAGEKLFFPKTPLYFNIGSVEEGYLSIGNRNIGGFFTHFFIAELKKNLWGYFSFTPGNNRASSATLWMQLLSDARKNTSFNAKAVQCGATSNDRCIQRAIIGFKPVF